MNEELQKQLDRTQWRADLITVQLKNPDITDDMTTSLQTTLDQLNNTISQITNIITTQNAKITK